MSVGSSRSRAAPAFPVIFTLIISCTSFLKWKKPVACYRRKFSSDRLCIFTARGPANHLLWPSLFSLFCCCESSLPAAKPKGQIFIYVFDFSNPGFRASKNRTIARFFERISFLYPQDGGECGIRTHVPCKGQLHFECCAQTRT